MKKYVVVFGLIFFGLVACEKEMESEEPVLPSGVSEYTPEEISFVNYSEGEYVFQKAPGFTETRTLNFKERLATKKFYAWDQTFLTFSSDEFLEIELRLRYLQTEDNSQKTLAIYMPYWDDASMLRSNLFELPLNTTNIETSFFSELIIVHNEIDIYGTIWNNVYEIKPLKDTPSDMDGENNYTTIFYKKDFGIIKMDLNNGEEWVLRP